VADGIPVTFCFTCNWSGGLKSTERTAEFVAAVAKVLEAAAASAKA